MKVSAYGAMADGKYVYDAALSGTPLKNLHSATAAFTPADIGKTVVVAANGGGGVDLVTTIATWIDAENVRLADAGDGTAITNAGVCFGTDNRSALQAAIDAATAARGSTLIFEKGIYLVAGEPSTAVPNWNTVLRLPDRGSNVATPTDDSTAFITLTFQGTNALGWYGPAHEVNASVLFFTATSNGNFTSSLIGGPIASSSHFGYGFVKTVFDKMIIRSINSDVGHVSLNLGTLGGVGIQESRIDVNAKTVDYVTAEPWTLPAYAKQGIVLPAGNNPCGMNIGNLMIIGQRIGMNLGPHFQIQYVAFQGCDHCVVQNWAGDHGSRILRMLMAECNYGFDGAGAGTARSTYLQVDQLDIEGTVGGAVVNDPNNNLIGEIHYRSSANGGGGGTSPDSVTIIGGKYLAVLPWTDASGDSAVLSSDYSLPTSGGTVTTGVWQDTGLSLTLHGAGDHNLDVNGAFALGTPIGAIAGVIRLYDVTAAAAIANSETLAIAGPQTLGAFARNMPYRTSGEGTRVIRLEAMVTGGTSAATATIKSGSTGRTILAHSPP